MIKNNNLAKELTDRVKDLYTYWNLNYCKGQILQNVGLHEEAYFRYFDYPDFLTPYSGLIQIRKYAEIQADKELLHHFKQISETTKLVKEKIYRLLVK